MSKQTAPPECRLAGDGRTASGRVGPFIGHVTSGLGRGADFVSLPGYAKQFADLLDAEPFPGTLNVSLADGTAGREVLDRIEAARLEGWSDGDRSFGAVECYPATVTPRSADECAEATGYVVVPVETDHDGDTIELVSSVELRDALDLADGDRVDVHVGAEPA